MTPHSHEFTFGVFSAKPVITRPVQVDGTAVRDALVMHVKKYGKCTERSKDAFVYATEDGGFTYYIENHASDSSVVSVCALESFNNLYLSRDHSEQKAIRCDDIVPPNSGMLVRFQTSFLQFFCNICFISLISKYIMISRVLKSK